MIKSKPTFYTSNDLAAMLGFSTDYVRRLIRSGRIKAEKVGTNWLVNRSGFVKIKRTRFPRDKEIENARSGERESNAHC
jgi:excisionase family DNA binding protein